MNSNFKIIGLTQLGIKLNSTAPEADAPTSRPFELLCRVKVIFLSGKPQVLKVLEEGQHYRRLRTTVMESKICVGVV